MLIKRLKLHNFIIFDDVDLSFEDVGLTTIIGHWVTNDRRSNGVGKSALIEAIPYALFGTTRSKQKMDIVRRGTKRCDVMIEFVASGRNIQIDRQRNSDGTSNAKMIVDGKQAAAQVRNVDAAVKQYLGIDSSLFELIYFFRQDDQFGFVNSSASERKSYLARVFDLGAVEACLAAASVRHKAAQEAQQKAEGAVEMLHDTLGTMPPRAAMEDRVLDLYDELSHYQLRRHSRELYMASVPDDISEAKRLRDEYNIDVAKAVEKLRALESEFNQNYQQIARISTEIGANETALKQQKSALDEMNIDVEIGKSISDWNNEIKAAEDEEYEVASKVAKLDYIIADNNQRIADVKSLAGVNCPTCQQIVTADHYEELAKKCNDAIKKNVEERSNLGLKLAMCKQKTANARNGKTAREQAENTQLQAARLQQAQDHLSKTTGAQRRKLSELDKRQSEIQAERFLLASRVNADEAVEVRHTIDQIIDAYSRPSTDVSFDEASMASEAAKAEERLDRYEEITGKIKQAEDNVDSKKREVAVCNHLCEIFGKNGLQAILIENVVSVIEQFANDILSQMQTRFKLSLKTQRTIQSGEQRETLEVVIVDNGEERMFETYSGGERTLINLALRLSLSRIISSLYGVVMQSLFLDEVLAALDEVNREEAIKVVAFLSKSFDQVFVISHTDEVKNIIPGQISIRRYEEHSEVNISNGRIEAQGVA